MMNDHAWLHLHAQREMEHRARARRRRGQDLETGTARTQAHTAGRRLGRRTASDAPTAAAAAWSRLATGAGTLEPSAAVLEREAA